MFARFIQQVNSAQYIKQTINYAIVGANIYKLCINYSTLIAWSFKNRPR